MKTKPEQMRTSQTALAAHSGISRQTVAKYLGLPGAPKPDKRGYAAIEAAFYIGRHYERGVQPDAAAAMRSRKLTLEVAALERQDALDRGDSIPRAEALKVIPPLMSELGQLLSERFVRELPTKAVGRSAADIQLLCEGYLTEALTLFKRGTLPLMPPSAQTAEPLTA